MAMIYHLALQQRQQCRPISIQPLVHWSPLFQIHITPRYLLNSISKYWNLHRYHHHRRILWMSMKSLRQSWLHSRRSFHVSSAAVIFQTSQISIVITASFMLPSEISNVHVVRKSSNYDKAWRLICNDVMESTQMSPHLFYKNIIYIIIIVIIILRPHHHFLLKRINKHRCYWFFLLLRLLQFFVLIVLFSYYISSTLFIQ